MRRDKISNAIDQIDMEYIKEAIEAEIVCLEKGKKLMLLQFHRVAACIGVIVFTLIFSFGTVFAASETFRQKIIEIFYPLYTDDEIKRIDDGHMTGSFDEIDTLLSFLDKFNYKKMEHGLHAKLDDGYNYSLLANSKDEIFAVVDCNIVEYKLVVTMEKIAYEDTKGIWQVVSYQVIDMETVNEMLSQLPEYKREEEEVEKNGSASMIEVNNSEVKIYNAFDKENIAVLKEEDGREIQSIFENYIPSEELSGVGLTEMVIKFEDVSYMFSVTGDVLIKQEDGRLSHILLSESDTERLLEYFDKNGIKTSFK